MLDWSFKDQSVQFPIGMGNSFSTTPFDLTGITSLFGATEQPLGHVLLALQGSWTGDDTFVLVMQGLDSIRRHAANLHICRG